MILDLPETSFFWEFCQYPPYWAEPVTHGWHHWLCILEACTDNSHWQK